MAFYKYDGSVAAHTSAPAAGLYGGDGAETLTGTSAHEQLWGAGGDVLIGQGGDDTYYLQALSTKVVEQAGAGVDKAFAWFNLNLAKFTNIENVTVSGDNLYVAGDGYDNIVEGQSGRQQVYGGGGQDVLLGGVGKDTFIVYKGEGNDVIQDFAAEDVIRLKANLFTFEAVRAAMTQVGADVRIDLGDGDGLMIRNAAVDGFTAANFQLSLDYSRLGAVTFAEEFSQPFSMWDAVHAPNGVWNMSYDYSGSNGVGSYTLTSNNEKQIYTSPYFRDYPGTFAESPFVQNADGTMSIWAKPSTSPDIFGYGYTSGLISTRHKAPDSWAPQNSGFSQMYGYFEMRADVPEAPGTWPAFWLLPKNFAWPPELDVMEVLGKDTNVVHTTVHSNETGSHTSSSQANFVPGDGFHTYGTMWTPSELIWYIDGVEVFRAATPADMHQEMSLLVNLALGGWAGAVDNGTLPAEMKIDYVRAYALPGAAVEPDPQPEPDPVVQPPPPATVLALPESAAPTYFVNGNGKANSLKGTAQADQIDGKNGADTMAGGAGDDTYLVNDPRDLVQEAAGAGVDTVRSTASSYGLGANVENLVLTGGSAQSGVGNELSNLMVANGAGSTLNGAAGRDVLVAGGGVDRLTGGSEADVFRFSALGGGADTVTDFRTGEDVLDLRPLFSGYGGADPIADGWLQLSEAGGATTLLVDLDGAGAAYAPTALVTLTGVSAASLTMQTDWVFL